jgi:hypothetical protein
MNKKNICENCRDKKDCSKECLNDCMMMLAKKPRSLPASICSNIPRIETSEALKQQVREYCNKNGIK